MNFLPTDEQRLAVEGFNRFLDSKLEPIVQRYRPDKPIEKERMLEIFQMMLPYGMGGNGLISEANGGMGMPWLTYAMMYDRLARISGDVAISLLIQQLGGYSLEVCTNEAMRRKYLPRMVRAEIISCSGISEPRVGSNVAEVTCRAKADGDHYVVNGEKTWISNGHYSDFCMVIVRTSDEGAKGLSMILVDRQEHGYESRNIDKLGLNSTSTAQLFFDNVRVPAANMMIQPGTGLKNTLVLFEKARPMVGLTSVGIAQAALDKAVAYAKERRQHGKPIGQHQLIQGMLADAAMELDAARLLIYRAFNLIDHGVRSEVESAMAKCYATEMAVDVASKAVQIHGGNGITKDFGVELLFRNARMMTIPDGTTEIQKLIIGRALTGLNAFS
ncbi:acyl-CoA dehydrogenase family protein [Ramlibacter albus]|uniref:Acyl-CoA dehydrogenase family protein n=1 Tax=Ramlibacter albus TaxID=2079448 RepID=A0A923M2V1_9BURK|nr:acyl-CoA dehydrogenase family protein [Ramlibacter albus]MBC5762885.1 acyl-CoA dehydrogenase family protein [Ramlibacter albus]